MTSLELFDKDYFENGVELKISGYENYHWRPEYVLPMANWLSQKFPGKSILDYGCAKGFLVKALKLLNVSAFGYDISKYAIDNCEPEVKELVDTKLHGMIDVIVAKDTLEHVPSNELPELLMELRKHLWKDGKLLVIVPLGDNDRFRIKQYEMDITHVTKKDEVWWINLINNNGFFVEEFYYRIPGIKDNWYDQFPTGNGIFIASVK